MSDSNIIKAFSLAARAVCPPSSAEFLPDGRIHRFHVEGDKRGSRNGWYVLNIDGSDVAYGAYGNWKTGEKQTWTLRSENDVDFDQIRMQEHIVRAKRKFQQQQRDRWEAAQGRASSLWWSAKPAESSHPYLQRKGVKPNGIKQYGDRLVIPLFKDDHIVNIQLIDTSGSKRFLSGGRVKDCYAPVGNLKPGGRIIVCEGWATGCTLHQETGNYILCAMNCHNLLSVAQYAARTFPFNEVLIAGDDDRQTQSNPGRSAARNAAAKLGLQFIIPTWPHDAPAHISDFNDLFNWLQRSVQLEGA